MSISKELSFVAKRPNPLGSDHEKLGYESMIHVFIQCGSQSFDYAIQYYLALYHNVLPKLSCSKYLLSRIIVAAMTHKHWALAKKYAYLDLDSYGYYKAIETANFEMIEYFEAMQKDNDKFKYFYPELFTRAVRSKNIKLIERFFSNYNNSLTPLGIQSLCITIIKMDSMDVVNKVLSTNCFKNHMNDPIDHTGIFMYRTFLHSCIDQNNILFFEKFISDLYHSYSAGNSINLISPLLSDMLNVWKMPNPKFRTLLTSTFKNK